MRFEWDEAKNQANIRKHGIDFNDVPIESYVFIGQRLQRHDILRVSVYLNVVSVNHRDQIV